MSGERNKVFIVNGRHAAAFDAIGELLLALGVEPVTWRQAVIATKKNNPNFSQILQKGFEMSAAVLVLLTPDEDTVLRTELRKPTDAGDRNKTGPVAQPRPNVLYELGYSMHRSKKKTIVILFEGCRVPSDMYGQHTIELIPPRIEHAVSEIQAALAHAEVVVTPLPEEQISTRCPELQNLSARSFESRDYIRAGTTVRSSEFAFGDMLDGQCDELVMIGSNFGDQFGSRERHRSRLRIISHLGAITFRPSCATRSMKPEPSSSLRHAGRRTPRVRADSSSRCDEKSIRPCSMRSIRTFRPISSSAVRCRSSRWPTSSVSHAA